MLRLRIIILLAICLSGPLYCSEALILSKGGFNSGAPFPTGIVFRQRETLNAETSTFLKWQVDPQRTANSTIIFTFSTSTANLGNDPVVILLGLSRSGAVNGSDVVVVAVGFGEEARHVDMHGVDNTTIVVDEQQNWNLVSSQRNASHSTFTVSRILDTCDPEDVTINNDLIRIIWGYGDITQNTESINFIPEGIVRAYLLDPAVPTRNTNNVQTYRLSRVFQMPPRHTSYWCTIHRIPQLSSKHHIVGFAAYFRDELSRQHVHHKLVYRCLAPPNIDPATLFDQFVGHPGEECYLEERHQLPTVFCTEVVMSWGVGGRATNLTHDVGLAIGDTPNEYFMFETHYDNPEVRNDLVLENGVDITYTPELRPMEGSLIFVSAGIFGVFQVPPGDTDFRVVGQCSSQCTKQMIPTKGVQVIAVNLHAHRTARAMIVRHFRAGRELPWLQSDLNYDFNYQQKRLLPNPVTILPGDYLSVECRLDTTLRNETTLSGFPTQAEMCMAWLVLNKRIPYIYCSSEYPTERVMESLGITNLTWTKEGQERVVNSARNPSFVGQTLARVIDQSVGVWTPEKIRAVEREQLYGTHESTCPNIRITTQFSYTFQFWDDLTMGLLPLRQRIEESRPSTRTLRTRLEDWIFTVTYPNSTTATIYQPPGTCRV